VRGYLRAPFEELNQAWFWSPQWQAGEREADGDRDGGRIESFSSEREFLDALRARAKGLKRPRAE
jgi:hypothetical protein